ncbi:NAD(P)H-binding protein [Escherichia coli]
MKVILWYFPSIVLLYGAQPLFAELISRGHDVIAVARNPGKLPANLPSSVTAVKDDLTDATRLAEIIAGADAVVSAFGPL